MATRVKTGWTKNLLLLVVTVIVMFAAAEIAVRVLFHQAQLGTVIRFDPMLGWSLDPGSSHHAQHNQRDIDYHIRINQLGMRDRQITVEKPEGIRRILVLGDSFVFGTGVEAEWRTTDVIGRALGDDVEVINAGVSGWGNGQELVNYETKLRRLHPDVVVLTIMAANDIINNMLDHLFLETAPKPRFTLVKGELRWSGPISQPPPPPMTLRRMLGKSQFLVLMKRRLDSFREHPEVDRGVAAESGLEPEWMRRGYSHWLVYERDHDTLNEGWEITDAILQRFAKDCREDGVELIVMAFPLKIEVDDAWRERLLGRADVDPATLDLDLPYRKLRQICQRNGIDFIYPLEEFRGGATRRNLYFRLDGHPNRYGHMMAARVLLDHLRDHHGYSFDIPPHDRSEFAELRAE